MTLKDIFGQRYIADFSTAASSFEPFNLIMKTYWLSIHKTHYSNYTIRYAYIFKYV